MKIAVLPGDGIGPEIMREAVKVLNGLGESFEFEEAPIGGAGYDASGDPLHACTRQKSRWDPARRYRRLEIRQVRPQAPPGARHASVAQGIAFLRQSAPGLFV